MAPAVRLHRNIFIISSIAVVILLFGLFVLHQLPLAKRTLVANALLFDILLTFPGAFYFLIIKPMKIRKSAMLLVFSCCCLAAYLILPPQQKAYVLEVRRLISLLELGFIVYMVVKIRSIRQVYLAKQAVFPDFVHNFRESMTEVLGDLRAVKFLAAELTIFRYSWLAWKKEQQPAAVHQRFTVHREAGYMALFSIILFVSLIEIVGLHLLITQNHPVAAFWLTLVSVYSSFFIVADMSAVVKRPIVVIEENVMLRAGFRWKTYTPINNIESITRIKTDHEAGASCFKGSITKSSANLLIIFIEEVNVDRLYKATRSYKSILLSMDDTNGFVQATGTADRYRA